MASPFKKLVGAVSRAPSLNFQKWKPEERELARANLRFATNVVMEEFGINEVWCNEIVAGGQQAWRIEMTRAFRQLGLMVNDHVCNIVFEFACRMVRARYHAQRSTLSAGKIAGTALNYTYQRTAPTDLEIVDSLELDSASSDDGRRHIYGRDGAAEIEFEKHKGALRDQLRAGGLLPYQKPASEPDLDDEARLVVLG